MTKAREPEDKGGERNERNQGGKEEERARGEVSDSGEDPQREMRWGDGTRKSRGADGAGEECGAERPRERPGAQPLSPSGGRGGASRSGSPPGRARLLGTRRGLGLPAAALAADGTPGGLFGRGAERRRPVGAHRPGPAAAPARVPPARPPGRPGRPVPARRGPQLRVGLSPGRCEALLGRDGASAPGGPRLAASSASCPPRRGPQAPTPRPTARWSPACARPSSRALGPPSSPPTPRSRRPWAACPPSRAASRRCPPAVPTWSRAGTAVASRPRAPARPAERPERVAVLCLVVTPVLNQLIDSLRSREVHAAARSALAGLRGSSTARG